ncbi:MAG TPA: SpoIID/LytB domain-containing protein [Leptospiraceae bacterium]|nr:SpoIID/LytB domain-containing protein [Leptospiraceae bacterium]HMW05953.1 SpoIID/LytB domain-containing protein [Leptospiraceae bacterium]HMX32115.1 SpoIID/LytB domain-containing protein [Leptospiraceae bacterium]HMY32307.1 SpoIID/LytB domain-containing protein [Leptospiraceae bacterium]HMZ62491.1 SpoIID/LytB domain-containing protein [Leptospiraceae bacterium]
MSKLTSVFISILFILLLDSCSSLFQKSWKPTDKELLKTIRVNLGKFDSSQEIKSKGKIHLQTQSDSRDIDYIFSFQPSDGKEKYKLTFDTNQFSLRDIPYRGELEIIPEVNSGKFIFVNKVPMEDYLMGVVPAEMPSSWPLEALKAQAVAARTYAVDSILAAPNSTYHVESTTQSQVYGGIKRETVRSNQAVRETVGEILIFQNKPARTFYHSNSGGKTESPEFVWGYTGLNYLVAIDSPHCKLADNFQWKITLTRNQMQEKLKSLELEEIKNIRISEYTPSGRAKTLEVEGKEKVVTMNAVDFRRAIGQTVMRSLLFDIDLEEDTFKIKGQGFGHGVGMSQWGSKGMAENNYDYKEILSFYYKGTDMVTID